MEIAALRRCLNDWAKWHITGNGYPAACTLGKLREPGFSGFFGSRVPRGIELPYYVYEISRAMEALLSTHGEEIAVVRAVYLRGNGAELKDVANWLGMPLQTLNAKRRIGEAALQGWIGALEAVNVDDV